MFVVRMFRAVINIVVLIAALASAGTLAGLTYDLAVKSGEEAKKGFISIAKLNKQLLSK